MTVQIISAINPYGFTVGNVRTLPTADEIAGISAGWARTYTQINSRANDIQVRYDPDTSAIVDFEGNRLVTDNGPILARRIIFGGIPFERTAEAAAANKLAMDTILAANTASAILIDFLAPYYFTDGFLARSIVYLRGMNEAAPIIFVPSTSNAIFFTWSRNFAHASQLTEELQLNGGGTIDLAIVGDRSVRANGLWMNGVDFPVMEGGFFFGLKGFSRKLSNTRVSKGKGSHLSYYCGYTDLADGANNVSDVILNSPVGQWDATNLITIADFQTYYAFSKPLELDGAYSNLIGGATFVVHQLARANVNFETNYLLAFPTYLGQPALGGYSAGGSPQNEYASMHIGVAGTSSVANRLWQANHANYNHGTHLKMNVNGDPSARNRFGQCRFVGGSTPHVLLVEGGSSLELVSAEIKSASPYAAAVSWDSATDLFTYSSVVAAGVVTKVPGTGMPITFPSGTLPAGVSSLVYYYLIKVSDTTFKIARTYNEAMAGTALNLTDSSVGATGVAFAGGMPLCVLGDNSRVTAGYKTVEVDNGAIGAWHCDNSLIQGDFRVGNLWTVASIVRSEPGNLLFVARAVRTDAAGNTPMKKLVGGRRYKIISIIVIQRGTPSAEAATIGIYSLTDGATDATHPALAVSAAMTGALGSVHSVKDMAIASNAGMVAGSDYSSNVSAPPFVYVSAPGAASSMVDVFVYGYPID